MLEYQRAIIRITADEYKKERREAWSATGVFLCSRGVSMTNRNVGITPTKNRQVTSSESSSRSFSQLLMLSRPLLLIAFAFTVMADPTSSVAYAIDAALRALNGDLALLLPTMSIVIAIIAVITIN